MTVAQLKINEEIRQRLGEDGLRELTACMWAVDCQTCGRFLGDDLPALRSMT